MAEVTFYHHERADGGRRTGLTVDGLRALERFVPGTEDRNPALRWYVDVICSTDSPPDTQEAAVEWLSAHAAEIRAALEEASEQLAAGMDMDSVPWSFERRGADGPMRVSISAMRLHVAADIANRIREFLATDWPQLLGSLLPVGHGARTWPTE